MLVTVAGPSTGRRDSAVLPVRSCGLVDQPGPSSGRWTIRNFYVDTLGFTHVMGMVVYTNVAEPTPPQGAKLV